MSIPSAKAARWLRVVVLMGSFLSGNSAARADTEYSRRVWRIEDGLPQNRVQAISQTPDGYLWIGTSGGLVRFDGVRFTNFDRSNTAALLDDSILSLAPSRDGGMWVGTEGGGLVHMKGRSFAVYGPDQGLSNGFVRALAEDRSGRLWVGTDRGFFVLEGGRLRRLDGKGEAPVLAARGIAEQSDGRVVVASSYGLFAVQGGDQLVRVGPKVNDLAGVRADPDGSIWTAAQSGLKKWRNGSEVPLPYPVSDSVRTPAFDSDGNLWVGTIGQGLARIGQNGLQRYRAPDPLSHNTVWTVFEDAERNVWAGTQDGLVRLSATAVRTVTRAQGLDDDDVVSVYGDPGGIIWIGTLAGRFYRMEGQRAVPFQPPAAVRDFHPRSLYVDPDGGRWFGSASQGVLYVGNGKIRILSMADGLRSNNIRQVLRDRQGVVWIATGSGLGRWDGQSLRVFYLEDGLAYGGVRTLAEDSNGDLLVGTDGGINRLRNGAFVRDAVLARLGNERVWSILPDKSGIWLGTRGSGLVRVRGDRVSRLTTRHGLPGNSIYRILDGGDGNLWMSSSVGVFSAARDGLDAVAAGRAATVPVVSWGLDEGMLTSQMNGGLEGAGFRSATGEFWFPSVKGAVRILPGERAPAPPRKVMIEAVVAGEDALVFGDGAFGDSVVIPPGTGKLRIDFTSPSLASPDRIGFQYRLEGFEDAWTSTGRVRSAFYTNIPPGRYRFHVVARGGGLRGSAADAVLPIVWQPHFYQTAWFYAALAVLAGLALFGALRIYARTTRARFALVLGERTRLAREMHDTVIQGCVGVSSLLEAARSLPPTAESQKLELLDRAAEQVRVTVNEAREAVWDLRHSDPSAERDRDAMVATLATFARQSEANSGIPVRVEVSGTPGLLGEREGRNLLLVAREAIRNAAAHAQPSVIAVTLAFEAGAARLEVADNGSGFVPDQQRTGGGANGHYGIVGMRERMKQSGGTLEMISSPGNGTRVVARLPLQASRKLR